MSGGRIFISYDSEDEAIVNRIVGYLESRGAPCWIASRDIPPRSIYAEAIAQAMREADACAVVLSERANKSDAIKRELELASHYRKPFIPIRLDRTEPGPGLDYYLRNTQWIDYGREREQGLERIITHMHAGAVAGTAPAPPPPRKAAGGPLMLVIACALLLVGAGGWFAAANMRNTENQVAAKTDPPPRPPVTTPVAAPTGVAPAPGSTESAHEAAPAPSTPSGPRDLTVGIWRQVGANPAGPNCRTSPLIRFHMERGLLTWNVSHDNGASFYSNWGGEIVRPRPGRVQLPQFPNDGFDWTDTHMTLNWVNDGVRESCEFERSL